MKMKPKAYAVGIIAAGVISLGAVIGHFADLRTRYISIGIESLRFVDAAYPGIMREQERRLGIAFVGEPNFSLLPDDHSLFKMNTGCYDYTSKTIGVNVTGIADSCKFQGSCIRRRLEKTLSHELGHFYEDRLGALSVQPSPLRKSIVEEGVAEYFYFKTYQKDYHLEDVFNDSRWDESDWDDLDFFYPASLHLVKPILDLYGDKAIRYLLENPPLRLDTKSLQQYQAQALDVLGKK